MPTSPFHQPEVNKMICTFPDCVAQSETGANRALTNDHTLLTVFPAITPFPIGTIGPKPIMATYRGIMNLPMIEGLYEGFTTYYSTYASGSVISPDCHVSKSNGQLQRWIQWGDTDTGNGSMIFLDRQLQKIVTLKMYRTNDLCYARVGNGQALNDTAESPSTKAAEYTANTDRTPTPVHDTTAGNTDVIHVVINNDVPPHTSNHCGPLQQTTPRNPSCTAWSAAPPLLQHSDTCLESDSERSADSSYSINTPDTVIPTFITTKPKPKLHKIHLVPKQTNSNRRYYIRGRCYRPWSTVVRNDF